MKRRQRERRSYAMDTKLDCEDGQIERRNGSEHTLDVIVGCPQEDEVMPAGWYAAHLLIGRRKPSHYNSMAERRWSLP